MSYGFYVSPAHAARGGHTPEIQRKAEQTAQQAMTPGFVRQVQSQAKRDARQNTYMTQDYLHLSRTQMQKEVSPDRSAPIAQTEAMLRNAIQEAIDQGKRELDRLFGQIPGKPHALTCAQTAEIYGEDGENIASYNSLGSGWTVIQTKAESKFLSASAAVYAQAYREAREIINAQNQAGDSPAALDLKI